YKRKRNEKKKTKNIEKHTQEPPECAHPKRSGRGDGGSTNGNIQAHKRHIYNTEQHEKSGGGVVRIYPETVGCRIRLIHRRAGGLLSNATNASDAVHGHIPRTSSRARRVLSVAGGAGARDDRVGVLDERGEDAAGGVGRAVHDPVRGCRPFGVGVSAGRRGGRCEHHVRAARRGTVVREFAFLPRGRCMRGMVMRLRVDLHRCGAHDSELGRCGALPVGLVGSPICLCRETKRLLQKRMSEDDGRNVRGKASPSVRIYI
ncbi:hypothetical protein DFJ77DRAFT_39562, partial [Powellomyces hirtus]